MELKKSKAETEIEWQGQKASLKELLKWAKSAVMKHPGQAHVLFNLGSVMLENGQFVLRHAVRGMQETVEALALAR